MDYMNDTLERSSFIESGGMQCAPLSSSPHPSSSSASLASPSSPHASASTSYASSSARAASILIAAMNKLSSSSSASSVSPSSSSVSSPSASPHPSSASACRAHPFCHATHPSPSPSASPTSPSCSSSSACVPTSSVSDSSSSSRTFSCPTLNLSSSMESYKMDLTLLSNARLTPQAQAAADKWIACLEEESASLTLMGMAQLHEWQQRTTMRKKAAHTHTSAHYKQLDEVQRKECEDALAPSRYSSHTCNANGDGECESGTETSIAPPSSLPHSVVSPSTPSAPSSSMDVVCGPSVELQEALRGAAGRYVIRRSNACKAHKEMKRRCPENCPQRKAGWSEKKAKKSMSNLRAKRTYAALAEQDKLTDQFKNSYGNSFQQKWRNRMAGSKSNAPPSR